MISWWSSIVYLPDLIFYKSTFFRHKANQFATGHVGINYVINSNTLSHGYAVYNKNSTGICNKDNCAANTFIYD